MQDIDFDEIDRAVSSITNSAIETNTPPAVVPAIPIVSPSPAVRRSSGRFMDVVHPSSDMRPETPARIPTPTESVAPREEVAEREQPDNQPAVAQSAAAFHWPDPIDIPEPTQVVNEQTPEIIQPSISDTAPEVVEQAPVVDEPDIEQDDVDATSLESPFLMDTKVEKRPLGAFSGADAGLPLIEDPIPSLTNVTTETETKPEVEEPSHEEHQEVPHELHETLLALDGHGQEQLQPTELVSEPTVVSDPVPVVDDIPVGPTSITQQYTEQSASASEPSGSIFDTEAYHKALTHPPKKRSRALIAVWVIALILIGGGIGAGVYYVVLPMLG